MPVVVIVAVILAIMLTSSWINSRNADWYQTLQLPPFTPPGWLISTVWTIIYILSGVAAWIVWVMTPHDDRFRMVAAIAGLNLLLNWSWSFIFFGLHLLLAAVIVAAALALTVWVLMILLWKRHKVASLLLIPYALWTPFATYLAYTIYNLNTAAG